MTQFDIQHQRNCHIGTSGEKLTDRGSWYRIGLNSTVPVTLATGDETRAVPKLGDVVHVEAELYFSRILPLLDPDTPPSSGKFVELSEIPPHLNSGDFIPLHEQDIEDDIYADDSTFAFLSKCYDVPEFIIQGIDSVLNLTGISTSLLEDVVQEISHMPTDSDNRPPSEK